MKNQPEPKRRQRSAVEVASDVMDALSEGIPFSPIAKPRRTIAALLGQIDFSPDNVVQAAAVNSVLFVDAVGYRYDTLSKRTAAKMLMEQITAGKDLDLRKEARAKGDKITERQIETNLTLDPDVAEAQKNYSKAEELDEYMKLVVEAFRMRRDCLQIVAGLVRNEMSGQAAYEAGAEKLAPMRKRLRDQFPGE